MPDGKLPSESRDLIGSILGKRVKNLIRVMKIDFDQFMRDFKIHENELFALGHGDLFIELEDGMLIGVSSRSLARSVILWLEREGGEERGVDYLRRQYGAEAKVIDCRSAYAAAQWSILPGQRIERVSMLKVANEPGHRPYPNERGLLLVGENGDELLVAREMMADGPAHMVLMRRDQIRGDMMECLTYEGMSA